MSNQLIRSMELSELEKFYQFIKRDFAPGEYPPFKMLENHLIKGIQEGLVFSDGVEDLAYAICASSHPNGYVLISQLSVLPEYRSQGVGSSFMQAMSKKYLDKKAIIVEVEKPECAKTEEEEAYRKKRITFYEKLGFCRIPNISYAAWDIPMHLMVLSSKIPKEVINEEIGEIICGIYLQLVGQKYIHNVQFQKL